MGFSLKGMFKRSRNVEQETRSANVPDKVYVEREGAGVEYSFDEAKFLELLHGFYGDNVFIDLFYCLPEIAAPVHEIANRVADATWQLCKVGNDEIDYGNAKFNQLFSNPNPLMSFRDFIYQAVCYEYLTGKQFFYVNVPGALTFELENVVNWYNLPAQKVIIDKDRAADIYSATTISDLIIKYSIPTPAGKRREFKTENVLPFLRLSLVEANDVLKCASPLLGADKAISNLIPVYEARGVIYVKRGALGVWVSKKGDSAGLVSLSKTEKQEAIDEMQSSYGLRRDKSPVAVTSAPMEFIRTAMSISELLPFDETLADAVAIYKTLGVPRHLVPSKDNSTFANADADMKDFYTGVIIPKAEQYAQAFTSFLKLDTASDKRLQRYIKPNFSHVSCLQADRKEEADVNKVKGTTYLERFLNSVCTLNDWIIANGDKKVADPLYDKRLLQMTPEELTQVKATLNLKINASTQNSTSEDSGTQSKSIDSKQKSA